MQTDKENQQLIEQSSTQSPKIKISVKPNGEFSLESEHLSQEQLDIIYQTLDLAQSSISKSKLIESEIKKKQIQVETEQDAVVIMGVLATLCVLSFASFVIVSTISGMIKNANPSSSIHQISIV